jgi:two-component system, OmpR family, sensor histidine kinase KdpD
LPARKRTSGSGTAIFERLLARPKAYKTCALLEAAHTAHATGVDVVIGYLESHGRLETERLMSGIEHSPPLEVDYRGIARAEFDLDAALGRRPAISLVDELAHANLVNGMPR